MACEPFAISLRTPLKSPRRRDIVSSSPGVSRLICLPETPEHHPILHPPSSPILSSKKKKQRNSDDRQDPNKSPAAVASVSSGVQSLLDILERRDSSILSAGNKATRNNIVTVHQQRESPPPQTAEVPFDLDDFHPLPLSPGDMTTLPLLLPDTAIVRSSSFATAFSNDQTTVLFTAESLSAESSSSKDQTTMLLLAEPPRSPVVLVAPLQRLTKLEGTPTRPPPTSGGARRQDQRDGGGALFGFSPLTPSLGRRRAQLAALTAAADFDDLEFVPQFMSTKDEADLTSLLAGVQPLLPNSPGRQNDPANGGVDMVDLSRLGTPKKLDTIASHLCLELTSPAKSLGGIRACLDSEPRLTEAEPVVLKPGCSKLRRKDKVKASIDVSDNNTAFQLVYPLVKLDRLLEEPLMTAGAKKSVLFSLDDELTHFFSPTAPKRKSKPRVDPETVPTDFIEEAIQASSQGERRQKKRKSCVPPTVDNEDNNAALKASAAGEEQGESLPVAGGHQALSKEAACLSDLLSSYCSPKAGASRRRDPSLKATAYLAVIPSTSSSRRRREERRDPRKRKLDLRPGGQADTGGDDDESAVGPSVDISSPLRVALVPVGDGGYADSAAKRGESPDRHNHDDVNDEGTPSRRSHRTAKAAAISYADFDDFDSADDEDEWNDLDPQPLADMWPVDNAPRRRFTLTAASSPARHRTSTIAAVLSPSVKQHFRERKRSSFASRGSRKCRLLVQNQPSEIRDLSGEGHSFGAASVRPQEEQADKAMSPVADGDGAGSVPLSPLAARDEAGSVRLSPAAGKYFSVVERTESAAGTIKLKLNRIVKRRQTLATMNDCDSPSAALVSSNSMLVVPRFSRSKTKDLGIGPQELVQFMAAASPPKVRKTKNFF